MFEKGKRRLKTTRFLMNISIIALAVFLVISSSVRRNRLARESAIKIQTHEVAGWITDYVIAHGECPESVKDIKIVLKETTKLNIFTKEPTEPRNMREGLKIAPQGAIYYTKGGLEDDFNYKVTAYLTDQQTPFFEIRDQK